MPHLLHHRVIGQRALALHLEGDYTATGFMALIDKGLLDPGIVWPVAILVDLRRSTTSPASDEVRNMAHWLCTRASKIEKVVVVTQSKLHFGLARMAMEISEGSGIEWCLVDDLDAGLNELRVSEP